MKHAPKPLNLDLVFEEIRRITDTLGRPPTGQDWEKRRTPNLPARSKLYRHGWTWHELLRLAGCEPTRQQAKLGSRALTTEKAEAARIALLELQERIGYISRKRWRREHGDLPSVEALMGYHNCAQWNDALAAMGLDVLERTDQRHGAQWRDPLATITQAGGQFVSVEEERDSSQAMTGYLTKVETITREHGGQLVRTERQYIQLR